MVSRRPGIYIEMIKHGGWFSYPTYREYDIKERDILAFYNEEGNVSDIGVVVAFGDDSNENITYIHVIPFKKMGYTINDGHVTAYRKERIW